MDDSAPMSDSTVDSAPPRALRIAFWNLQSLFDVHVTPLAASLDHTAAAGWDRSAFQAKVENLAMIINGLFDGDGPDLLAVCEIENERVARYLINHLNRKDFELALPSGPGVTAFDTALIYSKSVFECDDAAVRGYSVDLRYPTFDLLEVPLTVRSNGAGLAVLVSHWPSRSTGVSASEHSRMNCAEQCRRVINRHLRLDRAEYLRLPASELSVHLLNETWDRNILLLGDLNDEPWDRSVAEILSAGNSLRRMQHPLRADGADLPSYRWYEHQQPPLWDLMWALCGPPDCGTRAAADDQSRTMLMTDHAVVSRGITCGLQGLQLGLTDSSEPRLKIARPPVMSSPDGLPIPFQPTDRRGFSDHFPIELMLYPIS